MAASSAPFRSLLAGAEATEEAEATEGAEGAAVWVGFETGTGFDYTFADFNRWASAVGFKSTSLLSLAGPTSAAIAYK